MYEHSWPEYLSEELRASGFQGTVINGGVEGYSTSQELLKLIRDGVNFHPDVVISYSGVNDRGAYSAPGHPMVHSYQKELFANLASADVRSPFMASTIYALNISFDLKESQISVNLGPEVKVNPSEQWEKNVRLMREVALLNDAEFLATVQPYRWLKESEVSSLRDDRKTYAQAVQSLYQEITPLAERAPFIHDFSQFLETRRELFKDDGVHLTAAGDKLIASQVLTVLKTINLWQSQDG